MTQYTTHLDIKNPVGQEFDVQALVDACEDEWYNQTLCKSLLIDFEDRVVELGPRQAITVPRGVQHRPRAPQRTVVIMSKVPA